MYVPPSQVRDHAERVYTKRTGYRWKPYASHLLATMDGFCTCCGEFREGVMPYARRRKCEVCGKREVYGYQELLISGLFVNDMKRTDEHG